MTSVALEGHSRDLSAHSPYICCHGNMSVLPWLRAGSGANGFEEEVGCDWNSTRLIVLKYSLIPRQN